MKYRIPEPGTTISGFAGYLAPLLVLDPTPSVSQIVLSCTSPSVRPYTLGVRDCTILHLSQC